MKLINWDCLEEMKKMESESIDLIVTDPPYEVIKWWNKSETWKWLWWNSILKENNWKWWLKHNSIHIKDYIWEFYRVLKEWTHLYIMTNNKNLKEFLIEIEKVWFKFHNFLIWEKKHCNTNRWYLRNTEYILFFRKWKAKSINNKSTFPIFRFENETFVTNHPNRKPYELFYKIIENSSKKWETILDPFMWSWVSWVVCKNINRNFIGIELDKEYFEIAKKRIKN